MWGIWIVRNVGIFEGKIMPPFQSATRSKLIFENYKPPSISSRQRQINPILIDKLGACFFFFYGAS
jgi:hypothetical protein